MSYFRLWIILAQIIITSSSSYLIYHLLSLICMKKLPYISAFSYVLADFLFFQITSDCLIPCFFRSFSKETTTKLRFLHLLYRALSSILSRRPNHWSFLSCEYSPMIFNFSLVLSSCLETGHLITYLNNPLPCLFADFGHLNLLSSFR